jgi:hypothetical protein
VDSLRARVHEGFRRIAIAIGAVSGFVLGGLTIFLVWSAGYPLLTAVGLGILVVPVAFSIGGGAILLIGWILEGFFPGGQLKPQIEPWSFVISSDVDSGDFSKVFAKALLDGSGQKILLGLLEANGNNVTSREMAILKYVLGEEDKEFLMQTISQKDATEMSHQESEILARQMELLQSVVESEEFQLQQEERRNELDESCR